MLKIARIVTILVGVQMLAGCGEESSKVERTGKTSSQEAEKSSGAPVTWTPELVHGALKSKNPDYNRAFSRGVHHFFKLIVNRSVIRSGIT